jgi:hypothetical protein
MGTRRVVTRAVAFVRSRSCASSLASSGSGTSGTSSSVVARETRAVVALVPYGKDGNGGGDGDDGRRRRWLAHARAREETSTVRATRAAVRETAREMRVMARCARAARRAAPSASAWAAKARAYGERTWRAMGEATPGSVRRRIYDLGTYAMDRIDPRETTLCAMPRDASSMEVAYPRGAMDARRARREMRDAVERGTANARTATRMYAIGVPLSMPMFLSPVSNFPLYYFVFRLFSSTRATAAGTAAAKLLGDAREEREAEERAMAIEREILEIGGGDAFVCARVAARDGTPPPTRAAAAADAACCRLADPALEKFLRDEGPDALFVPCDALAEAARAHEDSTEKCAAARVEEMFGVSGVVELSRKHRRYDEIYA